MDIYFDVAGRQVSGLCGLGQKVAHAAESLITGETTNRNSLNLSRNSLDGP